jgi:hypothetical protein
MLNIRGSQVSRRVTRSAMDHPPNRPAISLVAYPQGKFVGSDGATMPFGDHSYLIAMAHPPQVAPTPQLTAQELRIPARSGFQSAPQYRIPPRETSQGSCLRGIFPARCWAAFNAHRDIIRLGGSQHKSTARSDELVKALVRHGADPRAGPAEVLGVPAGTFASGTMPGQGLWPVRSPGTTPVTPAPIRWV